MGLFDNAYGGARELKRQMKLGNLTDTERKRMEDANADARALADRVGKLVKVGRGGAAPIERVDVSELDAMSDEATEISDRVAYFEWTLREDIQNTCKWVQTVIASERNRRYKVRSDEMARLNNAQGSFQRPLIVMGNGMKEFSAAMDAYPIEALLGPNEVVHGAVRPPIVVTAEDAAAMTDKELEGAALDAYLQAHDSIGPAAFVDEVSRMAELLPEIVKAMDSYRAKRMTEKEQARKSHAILVAEQQRRKEEAARVAAENSRPQSERIADLERQLAELLNR